MADRDPATGATPDTAPGATPGIAPGSARAEILERIRRALGPAADPPPPHPTRPAYRRAGTADPEELVELFTDRLRDYRAGVHRTGPDGVADAVAALLAGTRSLVVPADLPDTWLPTGQVPTLRDGGADGRLPLAALDASGVTVLTGCAVAIAETGTIVLDAAAAQGRRALSLVPDHHVCVVRGDQVVATVPEGLARICDPTRPLTLISGPSATSDIELNRVEGVHGPRRLDVILVSSPA